MKTLLILRHGKAEPHNLEDKHRHLTNRGMREATFMGNFIVEHFIKVDLVISSDASRAEETARLAADAAGYKGDIDFQGRIYDASLDTLLEVVQDISDHVNIALLVGHNPGLEELLAELTGKSSFESQLSTGALAQIEFAGPWPDITAESGKLVGVWSTKGV